MESAKKADGDGERSEESGEEGTTSLANFMERYSLIPVPSEHTTQTIKQEDTSEAFAEEETIHVEGMNKFSEYRKRSLDEDSREKAKQKRIEEEEVFNRQRETRENQRVLEGENIIFFFFIIQF